MSILKRGLKGAPVKRADGMAGPKTLAMMSTFAADVTPEVVKKAAVLPDEEHFEAEPMPELAGVEVSSAAVVEAPKSIWGKVKGWF